MMMLKMKIKQISEFRFRLIIKETLDELYPVTDNKVVELAKDELITNAWSKL